MLFNSYEFIFLFVPVVLGIYFYLGKHFSDTANLWLVFASLFFYGYWDVHYLPLLLISIAFNYLCAGAILKSRQTENFSCAKIYFLSGLIFNVGLLSYYKYLDFFLRNFNRLGAHFELLHLILPLGISFFTITQLLYLYDCYEGSAKDHKLINYALFVSFFPHLMAGPILYHRQMMNQFNNPKLRLLDWSNMSRGLTLFIIGLMKKVIIADELSPYVQFAYSHTAEVDATTAWLATIFYVLQLYFDFSGYSDMAVGLARMMNLEIPVNFNSPYRATSVIMFWQRWHISLTNAITACVYIPILKYLKTRTLMHTITASFISFFIVGIWHGAGWTFVVFALLNSTGIIVNYIWRYYKLNMPKIPAHIFTLLFMVLTMVFFRAENMKDALNILKAMAHINNLYLPVINDDLPIVTFTAAALITAFCPNSNQLIKKFTPNYKWLILIVIGFVFALLSMTKPTEFLYFQF